MIFSNHLNNIEEEVFSIIFEFFLRPTQFFLLDNRVLKYFIDYCFIVFLQNERNKAQSDNLHKKNKSCEFILFPNSEAHDKPVKETQKYLETPKREYLLEKSFLNEKSQLISPNKLSQTFEILWDSKKCRLYKIYFLNIFRKFFAIKEEKNIYNEFFNYKFILKLLYINAIKKADGNKKIEILLLECLFLSLKKKEEQKLFFEDSEKKILALYCSLEEFYYFMFLLLIGKEIHSNQKVDLNLFFQSFHTIQGIINISEENQLNLVIYILEMLVNSFEILKNTFFLLNKEKNNLSQLFSEKKIKRNHSLQLINEVNPNLTQCFINITKNKNEIFSLIYSEDIIIKKKLIELYNKVIVKEIGNYDNIIYFPQIDFEILVISSIFQILLKQKNLKNKIFVGLILDNVCKIFLHLKDFFEQTPKFFAIKSNSFDLLALLISQLSFLNENYDISSLEKNEFFIKVLKLEKTISQIFSEETFIEIIKNVLNIFEEICEDNENNFNEVSKNIIFSFSIFFLYLFKKNNIKIATWTLTFIINIMKKYLSEEKSEYSSKKKGILSNFLNKLGINDQTAKKSNIRQNKAFFNEIQILLKKNLICLMKLGEKEIDNEDLIFEIMNFIESNSKIILDSSCDYLDFFHCLFYFCYKFSDQ